MRIQNFDSKYSRLDRLDHQSTRSPVFNHTQKNKNKMKYSTIALSALIAITVLARTQARADNMASIAITPATGAVTLAPRWSLGGSLAGFHLMAQDLSLGGGANQFYSIKATPIPARVDIAPFTRSIAASSPP